MNQDLNQLVLLQAIDLELAHTRAELLDAPKRVAARQLALTKAQAALTAAQKALAAEETLRRSQQLDVKERRGKISRLEKQMETATSAAQITALEHEIQFAVAAISKLEDEELASMERTEVSEAAEAAATKLVADTTAALATENARAADVATTRKALVAARETERTAVRSTIDEDHLSVYDRVAKSKGTGVSEAVDHKCSACQMMMRPQRWNDLTGRDFTDTIFHCETCGRMLFYDPRRDAPGVWEPGDRLTASKALTL